MEILSCGEALICFVFVFALLLALPAAADEEIMMTCGEFATRLDGMVTDMKKADAAEDKITSGVNQGLLKSRGRIFQEQCVDPYVCDEFADQMNSGKMPPGYSDSFSGMFLYLQNACGE